MKRALIAMSGGVDSSVAAYLAQREGYECIGCTMKLYTNTDAGISEKHTCCSLDDVEDARAVAYRLGMRYCVFNFSEGFRERVMLPFAADYRRARTPNPCIECNRRMKFNALFRRAEEDLCRGEAAVSDVNWISGDTPEAPLRCAVKIRYRAREQAATVYPQGSRCARIVFDTPQRAVTPGQAAVFYDGDTVLGGGTIE